MNLKKLFQRGLFATLILVLALRESLATELRRVCTELHGVYTLGNFVLTSWGFSLPQGEYKSLLLRGLLQKNLLHFAFLFALFRLPSKHFVS